MRNLLFIIFFLLLSACSDKPVDMDQALFERGGRWITRPDFHTFWFYNLKVYNGPAHSFHSNGEKKEEGLIDNGAKSGIWSGWTEKGKLLYKGGYINSQEDGIWKGYHRNGKVKYEGKYKMGKQVGEWKYYNRKGKLKTEEVYYLCDEKCEEVHYPRECNREGRIKSSKDF